MKRSNPFPKNSPSVYTKRNNIATILSNSCFDDLKLWRYSQKKEKRESTNNNKEFTWEGRYLTVRS